MVYGSREGDRDMKTVLYVYESQNRNGWDWCAVQTNERIGEVQRLVREKELPRIANKAGAVSVGVSDMARAGIDLDRVEFCRPPEPKPVASSVRYWVLSESTAPYPTEPGAPLTWQQAQARVDAGLEVETLRLEGRPDCGWSPIQGVTSLDQNPKAHKAWTYRVPTVVKQEPHALTIGKLTHELEEAKHRIAGLESVVDFKTRKVGALIQDIQSTVQARAESEADQLKMTRDLAETKTELAAARGLVKGLENDRDNWHNEVKRMRVERNALKAALGTFGL
jgi:hypothetical protein